MTWEELVLQGLEASRTMQGAHDPQTNRSTICLRRREDMVSPETESCDHCGSFQNVALLLDLLVCDACYPEVLRGIVDAPPEEEELSGPQRSECHQGD